jgi:exonuclease III
MAVTQHVSVGLPTANNTNGGISNFIESDLTVISYNMHGYNQGHVLVRDLVNSTALDVIMMQEHWLTPHNMSKFNNDFPEYYAFGSSALNKSVENGPLVGRPFGGTLTLIRNELMSVCECIDASERFVVVKVGDLVCINVYLPCVGTADRELICRDVLDNICYWRSVYANCGLVIGGDFNTELDSFSSSSTSITNIINKFLLDNKLHRCDQHFVPSVRYTYSNDSLNHYRKLDYFVWDGITIKDFNILDPDINLSDHLPIFVRCVVNVSEIKTKSNTKQRQDDDHSVIRLRWDHADLLAYYNCTFQHLQPIFYELSNIENDSIRYNDIHLIDVMYERIVVALKSCATMTVPSRRQSFFKFWWSQELDCLKQQSIDSNQLWKAAGRPRSGPVYDRRNKARREYRVGIRKNQMDSTEVYSNDLHEALLKKDGIAFWKCWKSKFKVNSSKIQQIDGIIDPQQVAVNFAKHFAESCSSQSLDGSANLTSMYNSIRAEYVGSPHLDEYDFDAELVEDVLLNLMRGKAAGIDSLTAEHLQYSHSLLPCVLAKLFNWIMRAGHVPSQFGLSYTIPLLKGNSSSNKRLSVHDYRGISISPVLSKVFEHCILRRFDRFLMTADNQFGFKKSLGCSQAIYSARCIVNHYVSNGSTVNLCALDITKAFDRMNHHGLFTKLMHRLVPLSLLTVLESWFSICSTCVNWNSVFSYSFKLTCGIRQGGVLSPYFFAIYINDVIEHVTAQNVGCMFRLLNTSIILYADDILLLAPSIHSLQSLLTACETKLRSLDLAVNVKKSVCVRIGPRCHVNCSPLTMSGGRQLTWVDSIRYLGVFITRSRRFCCSFDNAKKSFYRSFNAVFGKIGRLASEEVILHLIQLKCLPCMLFALEACPINRTELRSLDFPVTRVLMKLFKTTSKDIVNECQLFFGFPTIPELIRQRKISFLHKFTLTVNSICKLFSPDASQELYLLRSS